VDGELYNLSLNNFKMYFSKGEMSAAVITFCTHRPGSGTTITGGCRSLNLCKRPELYMLRGDYIAYNEQFIEFVCFVAVRVLWT
jgi:hypothetical protein